MYISKIAAADARRQPTVKWEDTAGVREREERRMRTKPWKEGM